MFNRSLGVIGSCVTGIVDERELSKEVRSRYQIDWARPARTSLLFSVDFRINAMHSPTRTMPATSLSFFRISTCSPLSNYFPNDANLFFPRRMFFVTAFCLLLTDHRSLVTLRSFSVGGITTSSENCYKTEFLV